MIEQMRGATRGTLALERMDRSGGLIVIALIGWLIAANLVSGGSSLEPVVLVIAVTLAYVLGRTLGRWRTYAPATIVVLVTLASFASAWPEVIGREPLAGPLGYQNANAALAVQAFAAASAIVVARGAASAGVRTLAAVAAIPFLLVPIAVGASAATAGALLVAIVGAWARFHGMRSIAFLLSIGFIVVVLATAIAGAVDAGVRRETNSQEPTSSFATRLALWGDALRMVTEQPIVGVGSGRFAHESPTARDDPDRGYAHQEFLQTAGETGVVGGALLVTLFLWAIVWTASRGTPEGAVVAAAVAALGVNACVDYVLRFPIVPIAAAVLVGGALAHRPRPSIVTDTRGDGEEGP